MCATIYLQRVGLLKPNTIPGPMFSKEDLEFVDFLFGKLTKHIDTDMIDLQDDDSCDDHLQFKQLEMF
jgi:hypothetical protein